MQYDYFVGDVGRLLERFETRFLEFLPNLVGALAILLAGWVLAWVLRFAVRRLIRGLDRLLPGERLQSSLRRLGMERPAADVIGGIIYWIVLIFFLTAATETMGLPVVTTWLSGVALYLPKILSAALIVFAGLVGGLLLRDLIGKTATSAGVAYGPALGRLAQVATLLISTLIAVDQIGVNIAFLTSAVITVLAAVFFGGALAFGLGARATVSNILASYYLQKTYTVGHVVSIDGQKGEIVQITPTAVVLESAEGRVMVPAMLFSEVVSVLLTKES